MIKTLVSQSNFCKTEDLSVVGSYNCLKKNTRINRFKNILKDRNRSRIKQKEEINKRHKMGKKMRIQEETQKERRKRRRIRNDYVNLIN